MDIKWCLTELFGVQIRFLTDTFPRPSLPVVTDAINTTNDVIYRVTFAWISFLSIKAVGTFIACPAHKIVSTNTHVHRTWLFPLQASAYVLYVAFVGVVVGLTFQITRST